MLLQAGVSGPHSPVFPVRNSSIVKLSVSVYPLGDALVPVRYLPMLMDRLVFMSSTARIEKVLAQNLVAPFLGYSMGHQGRRTVRIYP